MGDSYGYDPNYGSQNYDQFYDFPTGEMQTNSYPNQYPSQYPNQFADQYPNEYPSKPYNEPYTDELNEPPLMEELEINIGQIMEKTWAVLTFRSLKDHKNILHEPDLAGPIAILLTFGFILLFSGKIQFGYIYGLGAIGCSIIYCIVHFMAQKRISPMCVFSVLGYCMLPMVGLSAISILVNLRTSLAGIICSIIAILWCAVGASNLLVTAIETPNSRFVVAFPCALFYFGFTLLTVY